MTFTIDGRDVVEIIVHSAIIAIVVYFAIRPYRRELALYRRTTRKLLVNGVVRDAWIKLERGEK